MLAESSTVVVHARTRCSPADGLGGHFVEAPLALKPLLLCAALTAQSAGTPLDRPPMAMVALCLRSPMVSTACFPPYWRMPSGIASRRNVQWSRSVKHCQMFSLTGHFVRRFPGAITDNDQDALRLLLEPGLQMDAVGPTIDVAFC